MMPGMKNLTQTNAQELHVIFGTGPLGKWAARELVAMGHRVRLINRSGAASGLPTQAEVIKGDAYDMAKNTELTRGASAIYQCAQPAYHQWPGNFPRMQAAILEAAAVNSAKFIAVENLYMYGDTGGKAIKEDTPYNAHTRKGHVRQEMTEALFAAHKAGKVRAASVRGSDFFGPDDLIYGENLFQPALVGKPVNAIGSLDQPHTWTFAPDFGKTLAIVGTRDAALGQAWHVPSEKPVTQRQLIKMISDEIGQPLKIRLGTPLMLKLIGLFNPTLREISEMMYEFTQPFVMDSSAFTQAFGMQATPLAQQIRETVAWNRTQTLRVGAFTK
jgi:nucleoside-diphosphate-sugar epimerase